MDPGIPDLQRRHPGVFRQPLAIAARGPDGRVAPVIVAQSVRPRREHERRGEPLDVPLPRRRQCLVEIVDVEDDVALRRREAAEVQQMAIAAGLHAYPCLGRGRKISRHHAGGAAIEGERRNQHPSIPHRQQFRQPLGVRNLQLRDRIGAVRGLLPNPMRRPRHGIAQQLAGLHHLVRRPRMHRLHRWRAGRRGDDGRRLGFVLFHLVFGLGHGALHAGLDASYGDRSIPAAIIGKSISVRRLPPH